jgi:hypothetical protein
LDGEEKVGTAMVMAAMARVRADSQRDAGTTMTTADVAVAVGGHGKGDGWGDNWRGEATG